MHSLKLRYVNYFNKKHSRSGVLYQGSYKSIVVDKDSYMLEVLRYIMLNPLRAGKAERLNRYKWCSYQDYMGRPGLTDTEDILEIFGNNRREACLKLKEHVLSGLKKDLDDWKRELYSDYVLGSDEFIGKVRDIFRKKKAKKEVVISKNLSDEDKAENLLKAVCKRYNISKERLKGKRGSKNEARKIAMYLLCNKTGLNNKQIASFFENVHYSTISQMRLRVENSFTLRKAAERIIRDMEK